MLEHEGRKARTMTAQASTTAIPFGDARLLLEAGGKSEEYVDALWEEEERILRSSAYRAGSGDAYESAYSLLGDLRKRRLSVIEDLQHGCDDEPAYDYDLSEEVFDL